MLDRFKTAAVILYPFCLSLRENGHNNRRMISSAVTAEDGIVAIIEGKSKKPIDLALEISEGNWLRLPYP